MLKWKNGCIVDITQEEEEAIKAEREYKHYYKLLKETPIYK